MIKGIIFDYGGTIDARGDHWAEVMYDCYRNAGVDVAKEVFEEAFALTERKFALERHIFPGFTFADLMQVKARTQAAMLREMGVGLSEEKVVEVAEMCYQSARSSVKEAEPVIRELKKHYRLAVVSNFYGNIESVLLDMGIRDCFESIIESAIVGVRKPDPRIFELGVLALGLKPQETIVVGDSCRKDIAPALSLGCKAVWIKGRPWKGKEEQNPGAPVITSLSELPQVVTEMAEASL